MTQIIRKNLANALTVANLVCGLVSIYFTIRGNFNYSVVSVLLGGLADMFDGKVARMTRSTSGLGKYLDSNSDLLTFGVAPAALIYYSGMDHLQIWAELVIIFYIICASYRLAKYNLSSTKGYFIGFPTTLTGPILALSYFLSPWVPDYFFLLLTLLLGWLMISKIRVRKFWY